MRILFLESIGDNSSKQLILISLSGANKLPHYLECLIFAILTHPNNCSTVLSELFFLNLRTHFTTHSKRHNWSLGHVSYNFCHSSRPWLFLSFCHHQFKPLEKREPGVSTGLTVLAMVAEIWPFSASSSEGPRVYLLVP